MIKKPEYISHVAVVSLLKKLQNSGLDFLFWHAANGGSRNKVEAAKFKMMGLTAGVLDIQIVSAKGCGFLEFKTMAGGLSTAQIDFIDAMRRYSVPAYTLAADKPSDMLKVAAPAICSILQIDQNSISGILANMLASDAIKGLEKSR